MWWNLVLWEQSFKFMDKLSFLKAIKSSHALIVRLEDCAIYNLCHVGMQVAVKLINYNLYTALIRGNLDC